MWEVSFYTLHYMFPFSTNMKEGSDKTRPLLRIYTAPGDHQLFIHSCSDTGKRLDESIEKLHFCIQTMQNVGSKFIWILINKQDTLPNEQRASTVDGLRRRFEQEISRYDNIDLVSTILDLPGFSALTGDRVCDLMLCIEATLENDNHKKQKKPQNAAMPASSAAATPSDSELIARIRKESAGETGGDKFWRAFLANDIPEWNHRTHLRVGYFTLLETFKESKGILDAAKIFLEHLSRLKEAKPERYRNTEHRTLTVFWLYHLQLAILDFKHSHDSQACPSWDSFQAVLLQSPRLMNESLWKDFYSNELLFGPEAKEYWRLPDLQALPDFTQISLASRPRHIHLRSQEEPYRVMRFAFSVVQKYMSSNVRRGWLVKQALASLQSTTMRLRANNPAIPPYSETQAYFWIQLIHAALVSEAIRPPATASKDEPLLRTALSQLSFPSFRVLFDIEHTRWKLFYTPKTWDSIKARMEFVNPDLKPLPNILSIPSLDNIGRALDKQLDIARLGLTAELPSMEDLAFRAALVLEDSRTIQTSPPVEISSHAHLLLFLYADLVSPSENDVVRSPASRAPNVLMRLSGPYITSFTQKVFWIQQILDASSRDTKSHHSDELQDSPSPTFEEFLKSNMQLVYEDLPLCYYSPEALQSYEAKETFVVPDKRSMKAYFAIEKKEEDEWIVL
jgi:hypothetical protein